MPLRRIDSDSILLASIPRLRCLQMSIHMVLSDRHFRGRCASCCMVEPRDETGGGLNESPCSPVGLVTRIPGLAAAGSLTIKACKKLFVLDMGDLSSFQESFLRWSVDVRSQPPLRPRSISASISACVTPCLKSLPLSLIFSFRVCCISGHSGLLRSGAASPPSSSAHPQS